MRKGGQLNGIESYAVADLGGEGGGFDGFARTPFFASNSP